MARPELPDASSVLAALLMVALAAVAVAIEAAPLGLVAGSIPSPDLVACVVACVAVRRPDAAPILLVFALGLARDLITDVPPGAGALSLVLFAEALRARSALFARRSIAVEIGWVAGGLLAMLALQYGLVLLTFSQPPYVMSLIRQWALTTTAYPLVVLALRWGAGVRWRAGVRRRAP